MEAAVGQTTTTVVAGDNDGRKDPTNVVKGKRTKRQRPQSPISFTISSNNDTNDRKDVSYNNSPACSSGFPAEEDEETAECLILLSRGESKKNKDDDELYTYKFNSKKYIQTPENATAGKVGVFVYECKTCGRSFPSFQALGGHRASHKKPKNNDDKGRPPPYTVVSGNDDPSPSAMFTSFNKYSSSLKLHECSICGTEFNSGQALGGHMRRHRVAGGNKGGNSNVTGADAGNTNNVALSLIPFNPVTAMEVHDEDDQKSKNDALCLDLGLDLNLPAPVEATGAAGNQYHQERSSAFTPAGENRKKKRPDVHFSAAGTLVDSHY